ncbi:MAG: lamin tail domain-containing protein [Chitinispirillales bacterium]|jgi:hypothetical protein|nr:lamin tail domain-containing protein [Chitinispirillales bacterium]
MLRRNHYVVFGITLSFLAISFSCGKTSAPTDVESHGTLEVRARVLTQSLSKQTALAQTIAENLVVEISGDDMATIQIVRKLDFSRPALNDTLTKIPVGKNRRISVWALSRDGAITHIDSLEHHVVNIELGKVSYIITTLIPAAGSIYLQLAGLGTNADSIHAIFTSFDENFTAKTSVKRASKTFVSLDNIPHLTAGHLSVTIKDVFGDTLYIAGKELIFNARSDNSIDLQFTENGGNAAMDISIYEPGVTVGSYDFGSQTSSVTESGELIISEVMWNASDSNYIELYNTTNDTLFYDTLTTDIDGVVRHFTHVQVLPHGFLVIGRMNLPHLDLYTPTTGGLPITSTGNWITIKRKDGTVINRVICAGSNRSTGWPQVSGKRSVELARDKYNAADNKFGKHWSVASQRVSADLNQYGTPGF